MIRQEQNDGVVGLLGAFKHIHDLTDFIIDIGHIGKIGLTRSADIFARDVKGGMIARLQQTF